MLQEKHSAILSTFTKLPFVIKIFILSIFEWLFTQILMHFDNIFSLNALRHDCNGKCIEWIEGHYLEVVVEVCCLIALLLFSCLMISLNE